MRAVLAALLALHFCPAAARAQSKPPSSANALDEGVRLVGAGRFAEAVAALNRSKQGAPGDPRPYFYAGMALSELGRLSAAAQEIAEAVRIAPERPEYRVFQANVLARLKQTAEAIAALALFERKAALQQLDGAWLRLLVEVYTRLERYDGALGALDVLGARDRSDARVELLRGKVHVARGELEPAAAAFRKSIAQSPKNPAAHLELGKLLQLANDFDGAKRALAEALRQDSTCSECLLRLGLACLALGENAEALEHLKRAEPAAGSLPQVHYALGNAYQALGDRARAIEYRRKYQAASAARREREERERDAGLLVEEAERRLDRGDSEAARRSLEEAVRLDPDNWDAHAYLAEGFLASGEPDRARDHLAAMERVDPESVVGNYLAAKYWYARKDYERARLHAERVRSFRPEHAELRALLGRVYLGLGRRKQAAREYEAAVRLAPDRSDFRDELDRIKGRP